MTPIVNAIMEKANKYILVNEVDGVDFRCGFVFRHADLLSRCESDNFVLGGGRFCFDEKNKAVILYGSSDDYGYPQDFGEILKRIYDNVRFCLGEEYYWHYSEDEKEMPLSWRVLYTDPMGITRDAKTGNVVLLKK
jgi:hypothetical protein